MSLIGYSIRVGNGKNMKDFTLARFHHFRFLIRFMIVPQKMQKATYNEVER